MIGIKFKRLVREAVQVEKDQALGQGQGNFETFSKSFAFKFHSAT